MKTDGTVWCWGWNNRGQLGDASTSDRSTPVQVTGGFKATAVSAAGQHRCALVADGTVRCWGSNLVAELGGNGTSDSATPVSVAGLSGAVEIFASGGRRTCARRKDATVWCWGERDYGTPLTSSSNHLAPGRIAELDGASLLATASYHTCARLADGRLRCAGVNGVGQLGDETQTTRNALAPAHLPCP